jgi:subtilisin family serine protease
MRGRSVKLVATVAAGILVLYLPFSYLLTTSNAKPRIPPRPQPQKAEEYLIRTRATNTEATAKRLSAKGLGITNVQRKGSPVLKVNVSSAEELRQLQNDPEIEYVEKNRTRRIMATPDDPGYAEQWNLTNINLLPLPDANSAWQTTTGSASTIIAVIDTGIDLTHAELIPNLYINPGEIDGDLTDNDHDNLVTGDDETGCVDNAIGRNFALEDTHDCANVQDTNGHGTHVSGIIAAAGNNSTGISGVCWTCKIMPLRVINSGGFGFDSDIADAIHYAVDHGAQIINMSLGGAGYSQTLQDAIDYAWSEDVLVISAAGNFGSGAYTASDSYPGGAMHTLTVSAVDSNDDIGGFSLTDNKIDISAPGQDIISTYHTSYGCRGVTGKYACLSGTSMAAPHVAGVAGLLYDLHKGDTPPWTAIELRQTLLQNTDLIAPRTGYDSEYGFGRLNAESVVTDSTYDLSDLAAPTAILNAPGASVVKGNLQVVGTAEDPNLYMYTINFAHTFGGYIEKQVSGRVNITSGTLATINTNEIVTIGTEQVRRLPDDDYTLTLRVEDFAGNITVSDPIQITIDNTSPTSFNVASPIGSQWVTTTKPTFSWTPPSDVSSLTYDLVIDGNIQNASNVPYGQNITGTSHTISTDLSQGSHTWYVTATDAAENPPISSNQQTFIIDSIAPNSFSVGVAINTNVPTFTFVTTDSGSGVAGYEVSINGGGFFAATSPYTYSSMGDGSYSASVRARDTAGNTTTVSTPFTISYRVPYLLAKADFNTDSKVDILDFSLLAANWNKPGPVDANNDGKCDILDFSILASNWNKNF